MKFRILRNVPSNLVKERVPTKYKDLAVTCESQLLNTCSLIIFPHDKRNVVKSGLVEKSLKSLGESSDPQLVVVGSCFSVEATNLLNRKNAVFISLFEDHRKDSYQNKLHLEHVRY